MMLSVQFNERLTTIEFFLNGNVVYDIGIELCQTTDQVSRWSFHLGEKRWITENNGVALFLEALKEASVIPLSPPPTQINAWRTSA